MPPKKNKPRSQSVKSKDKKKEVSQSKIKREQMKSKEKKLIEQKKKPEKKEIKTPKRKEGEKRISLRSKAKSLQQSNKKSKERLTKSSSKKSPQKIIIKQEKTNIKPIEEEPLKKLKKTKDLSIKKEQKEKKKIKIEKSSSKKVIEEKSLKKERKLERSRSKSGKKEKETKKESTPKKVRSSNKKTKDTPKVIITAKKIKEEPEEIEESSSSENENQNITQTLTKKKIKGDFTYEQNSNIRQEIEKILKKIDSSKSKEKKLLGKKKLRRDIQDKNTAESYNYVLQKNPNINVIHAIDLEKLSKQPEIHSSDVFLSLLEVGQNHLYYNFAFSNRSKMFWEDILKYKTLSRIFDGYKSETLRKYWRILSKCDTEKAKNIVIQNKNYLDNIPIKLRTIAYAAEQYSNGNIDNFEEYIKNILVDIRKKETYEQEFHNPITGEITKIKNVRTTTIKRKRYEPGMKKNFIGKNTDNIGLEEIYNENKKQTNYQNVINTLSNEDTSKFKYLQQFTEEEKKKLLTINEDDKFIFKSIDNVLDGLCNEFPNLTREYVLDMLVSNSMNIARTYLSLSNPEQKKIYSFTQSDDNVILKMKNSEQYQNLINEKGKELVDEREEFLNS